MNSSETVQIRDVPTRRAPFYEPQWGRSRVPFFSIIIPVRDRLEELKSCLAAINRQLDPPDFEVVIIDDGSKVSISDLAADGLDECMLRVVSQPPLGISYARNSGIAASCGRWIVFIDSDCEFDPRALNILERIVTASRHQIAFQLDIRSDHTTLVRCMEAARLTAIQSAMRTPDARISYLNTSGVAIRGDYARSSLPLFDSNLVRSEDTGLLSRLVDEGHTPVFAEGAAVFHRPRLPLRGYLRKHFAIGLHSMPARQIRSRSSNLPAASRRRVFRSMRMHVRTYALPSLTLPMIVMSYSIELTGRFIGRLVAFTPGRYRILGCPVDSIREAEVVRRIVASLRQGGQATVTYLHAWSLVQARRFPGFSDAFEEFDVIQPDGMGVVAALFLGCGVHARKVTANEYFKHICAICAKDGFSMALVGGAPDVIGDASSSLREEFPKLRITHVESGFVDAASRNALLEGLKAAPPCLLVLGMGQPIQERLAMHWRKHLPRTTIVCVGGLFDYIAGRNVTPPRWVRFGGLEWMVRLITHPRRDFRRYVFGIPALLYYLGQETLMRRIHWPTFRTRDRTAK